MQIRHYHKADLDRLLYVWESASRLAHPFLSAEFLIQERDNIPNLYLPNADTWVVEVDHTVVGFIALLGNEVGALFVEPLFHGLGLGRALMDKAQQLQGELEVEVFTDNPIGRQFYKAYGFRLMEEKIHPPTGLNVLRLQCPAPR